MIHLFKSHYSLNSILTLEKPNKELKEIEANRPVSICDIAKFHKLEKVILVEDSIAGFIEAYKNMPCAFLFGWRVTCCADLKVKDDESYKTNHKIVIFINNTQGYNDFLKIHNRAATDGFYYEPRIDFQALKELWTDNLTLAIPFYDSFLHINNFTFNFCLVDFGELKPVFFIEQHGLPFDVKLKEVVEKYTQREKYPVEETRSIYYYRREDFLAYMTLKCLKNRSTWSKPDLNFMSSDDFCFIQ